MSKFYIILMNIKYYNNIIRRYRQRRLWFFIRHYYLAIHFACIFRSISWASMSYKICTTFIGSKFVNQRILPRFLLLFLKFSFFCFRRRVLSAIFPNLMQHRWTKKDKKMTKLLALFSFVHEAFEEKWANMAMHQWQCVSVAL